MTSSIPQVYHDNLPHLGKSSTRQASNGADCLGAHVEGPFLNTGRNGIHTKEVLQEAQTWSDIEACYGKKNIKNIRYITAAPELGNMMELIPEFTSRDIIYSTGHSDATYEQAQQALQAGASMVTHMFNAMRPFGHRDPGIFGLLGQSPSRPATPTQSPKAMSPIQSPKLQVTKRPSSPSEQIVLPRRAPSNSSNSTRTTSPRSSSDSLHRPSRLSISTSTSSLPADPPFFGLIADGIHLAPQTLKIAHAAHPTGTILVTDAMPLTGLPDGIYSWTNGENIIKSGSKLTLEKNGRIAGAAVGLLECVNNFVAWTGCGVGEGLRCVTETPSKMLGEHKKGKLDIGCDADLCVLEMGEEGDLKLRQVWKFGECVHAE